MGNALKRLRGIQRVALLAFDPIDMIHVQMIVCSSLDAHENGTDKLAVSDSSSDMSHLSRLILALPNSSQQRTIQQNATAQTMSSEGNAAGSIDQSDCLRQRHYNLSRLPTRRRQKRQKQPVNNASWAQHRKA